MATSTVEDYVKQIYIAEQDAGGLVSLGKLAAALGVVPGTATTMVKALAESGLVHYEPRQGVSLTASGERLALHVLRRHRLIEAFLVKVLDYDWSEVHDEAEDLEHAVSDRLLERIDDYLGHPGFDPHGDPIPNSSGKVSKRKVRMLSSCAAGEIVVIARIADQDSDFLRYAEAKGLIPGAKLTVHGLDKPGDSLTVSLEGGKRFNLGGQATSKLMVSSR